MKLCVLVKLVIFVLAMLAVVSCTPKERPVLRVGTGAEYPPFSYMEGDRYMGVDPDVCRRIADKLGMDIVFTKLEFSDLFSGLASNKIDIAADALTITTERKKTIDFSPPYFVTNQALISLKDRDIQIANLEEVAKYKVGTLDKSTGHTSIDEQLVDKDLMSRENLLVFPTNIDAINNLMAGKVDLVVLDDTAANGYSSRIPIKIVYTIQTNEEYGLAMQKGKAINDKINKALSQMIADGELKDILAKNLK